MKNREVFLKDPLTWTLVNEGVSSNNVQDLRTLKYELETFVCQGEYESGLGKILQGYLENLGKEQKAGWVSGFYGSGKSHLVKVLRYLWTDFPVEGSTARNLATLPKEIQDLLKELSTRGKQGAGLHSCGGTLKAGVGSVRLRLLGIIFGSVGLPEKISTARLVLDLRDEGKLEDVQAKLRKAGKSPETELERMYTSKALHEAYLAAYEHLGKVENVSQALREQYPTKVEEVSIQDMLSLIRRALSKQGRLPSTVVVLDEVQQFINNDPQTALEVQEIVEACSKELDGRVLFVGTGQSALTDTPALQRLMGRFTIKVHLKDNDVEKVVRTVVLQKKEARKKDLADLASKSAGEISRQLKSTKIATRAEDEVAYVPEYPLLPVRRRFWEHVLHSCDPTGTAAQMRTQLRVTHEACRSVADKPLGAIIPADFLYDQLANDLVISGEMQKRFQEIIEEQKSKTEGALRSRISALVFLINKLPREAGDIGVRANVEHLADLLTDDLGASATALREKVPGLVQQLVTDGVLMEIDGEFHLQTSEGAAWESEFKRRRATILNDDAQIAAARGQLLSKAVQEDLASVNVLHGAAREKRKVHVHHGMDAPAASEGLCIWVRDGFQESESSVLQDIQKRSVEDPTIHVLIPKTKTDELKNALASSLAAEETLNFKGQPTAQSGREARAAMTTRQNAEAAKVEGLVAAIVGGAKLFLSGGQELPQITIKEGVEDAAKAVLARLFPKFSPADSANWPTVWKKAKEGNAGALSAVTYQGDPDKHSVAGEVLKFIGAGKKGADVITQFTAPPFGWPKDAVDASIAVLMTSGHLGARLQGVAVKIAELDQRKIAQADYRMEHPVLTAAQKLRIKKLFQDAGHKFQPGDEVSAAPGFVVALGAIAASAGGEPPAPTVPQSPEVTDLQGLLGNDLLFRLFEKADGLTTRVKEWKSTAEQITKRMPAFQLLEKLLAHGSGLEGVDGYVATAAAIRANRSLLHDPDPTSSALKSVSATLRSALEQAYDSYSAVFTSEREKLTSHSAWTALTENKKQEFLGTAGITSRGKPLMGSETELLTSLDECNLAGWRTHADALPTRFQKALAAAIREGEPKARRINLPPATIKTKADLDAWLESARSAVESALKDGPVIL